MWDKTILTDLTVPTNRPDIVFKDKKNKRKLLIDVSCPCDSNVALKQTEKMTKYRLLMDEVHRMWNTRVSIVPVVIGTLGAVKNGQTNLVASLPGSSKKWCGSWNKRQHEKL